MRAAPVDTIATKKPGIAGLFRIADAQRYFGA